MRPAVLITTLAVATAGECPAQAPPGYYASVVTTSPAHLRSTLHDVIDDHTRFPYTAASTDTWDILELADQHPTIASQILDLYRNAAYQKQGGGNSLYNREHTWPNSYGFPNDGPGNYAYTDCHQLFLCDIAYNGARDRRPFDVGNAGWTRYATDVNAGQGGGSSVYPGNANWRTTSSSPGGWEVWSARKGDVARALLYLDVRYEGGMHGVTGFAEPDLILTDDLALVTQSATGSNLPIAYMGKLGVLLAWHAQDPVDNQEMARNDVVFAFQGNRNPFIDHPEWVDCLYLGSCNPASTREAEIWINELHYENSGPDIGELVEIAGHAGERVDGWLLVGYDGATGQAYDYIPLRGTFADQQNGFGTLSFLFPGLQNGSPDGIALVAPNGSVMQFLSYEGVFQATNGAAEGLTSVDIGVSESSATPVGQSLQLSGSGDRYSQFTWRNPATATPGAINAGQVLQ